MHEIVCVGDVHEGLNFDFRIDPEIEVQALVDGAHADDFVHPGLRKGPELLIMSTRRSAKVSNHYATLAPPEWPGNTIPSPRVGSIRITRQSWRPIRRARSRVGGRPRSEGLGLETSKALLTEGWRRF